MSMRRNEGGSATLPGGIRIRDPLGIGNMADLLFQPGGWSLGSRDRSRKPGRYVVYVEEGEKDGKRTILELEASGFGRDDIEIAAENGILDIKGERKERGSRIGAADFSCSFVIPDGAEIEGADLECGILTVRIKETIPESARRRTIPIGSAAKKTESAEA